MNVTYKGARWDIHIGSIAESALKDLYPSMPVMYIRAITQDKQETRNLYECPVYKTRQRGNLHFKANNCHDFDLGYYLFRSNLHMDIQFEN